MRHHRAFGQRQVLRPASRCAGDVAATGTRVPVRASLGDDPFHALAEALVSLADARTDRPRSEIINDLAKAMANNGLGVDIRDRLRTREAEPSVVLFDQFEEIFTGDVDPDVRRVFLDHLSDLVDAQDTRFQVALTIRSDYVSRFVRRHGSSARIAVSWSRWAP